MRHFCTIVSEIAVSAVANATVSAVASGAVAYVR
jgi:hypothetical protein